jgi:NADH dehydrogenase FAD-containing subunit
MPKTASIEPSIDVTRKGTSNRTISDRSKEIKKGEESRENKLTNKKPDLFELQWDKLVIAVECYSQTFGTPGVRENVLFLKDVEMQE